MVESECKDDFRKYSDSDSDNYNFKHSGSDSVVKSILNDSERFGDEGITVSYNSFSADHFFQASCPPLLKNLKSEYSPLFAQLYSSKMLTGEDVNFELRSVDTISNNVVCSDQISDTFCDKASGKANDVSD